LNVSKPEKKLTKKLRSLKIKVQTQKKINGHKVDIFIKPNICVEVDGKIWHNFPFGTQKDHAEESWLRNNGYIVLRFWDSEVNENIESVVATILAHKRGSSAYQFTNFALHW